MILKIGENNHFWIYYSRLMKNHHPFIQKMRSGWKKFISQNLKTPAWVECSDRKYKILALY